MTDLKITQLTELTSATTDDLLPIVDDPGGSPVTKKITLANLVSGLTITHQFTFAYEGSLLTSTGAIRMPNEFGRTLTISKVMLNVSTAPTGANIIVDINKNGTTIFTNQANRPVIVASAFTGNTTTIDVPSLAADDYLTFDVDQVGSTIAGSDLSATVIAAG